MTHVQTRSERAYYAAISADVALSAELRRLFGAAAGDRRYDPKRIGWDAAALAARELRGSTIRELHAAWAAMDLGGAS